MRAQRLSLKRLLNLIERLALRLRHEEGTHQRRQQRTPPEEKVRAETTLRQQDRRRQRDKEISNPVTAMRETSRRGAGALGLDLRGVDLDADGPGEGEDDGEEVDGDDDEPASRAGPVDCVGGVEGADEEHGCAEADAAGDDA